MALGVRHLLAPLARCRRGAETGRRFCRVPFIFPGAMNNDGAAGWRGLFRSMRAAGDVCV